MIREVSHVWKCRWEKIQQFHSCISKAEIIHDSDILCSYFRAVLKFGTSVSQVTRVLSHS